MGCTTSSVHCVHSEGTAQSQVGPVQTDRQQAHPRDEVSRTYQVSVPTVIVDVAAPDVTPDTPTKPTRLHTHASTENDVTNVDVPGRVCTSSPTASGLGYPTASDVFPLLKQRSASHAAPITGSLSSPPTDRKNSSCVPSTRENDAVPADSCYTESFKAELESQPNEYFQTLVDDFVSKQCKLIPDLVRQTVRQQIEASCRAHPLKDSLIPVMLQQTEDALPRVEEHVLAEIKRLDIKAMSVQLARVLSSLPAEQQLHDDAAAAYLHQALYLQSIIISSVNVVLAL